MLVWGGLGCVRALGFDGGKVGASLAGMCECSDTGEPCAGLVLRTHDHVWPLHLFTPHSSPHEPLFVPLPLSSPTVKGLLATGIQNTSSFLRARPSMPGISEGGWDLGFIHVQGWDWAAF